MKIFVAIDTNIFLKYGCFPIIATKLTFHWFAHRYKILHVFNRILIWRRTFWTILEWCGRAESSTKIKFLHLIHYVIDRWYTRLVISINGVRRLCIMFTKHDCCFSIVKNLSMKIYFLLMNWAFDLQCLRLPSSICSEILVSSMKIIHYHGYENQILCSLATARDGGNTVGSLKYLLLIQAQSFIFSGAVYNTGCWL